MQHPKIPDDEQQRQQALEQSLLLKTGKEQRFDHITQMALNMFDVPIAFISLIDNDTQRFKSMHGLNLETTTRNSSFCGHTILHDEVLVVNDTKQDKRFQCNPLVLGDDHIEFYAGAPLSSLDGHNIGTICIADHKPRTFTEKQCRLLEDLAEIVQREIYFTNEHQQQLENYAAELHTILETVNDAIITVDDAGKIQLTNHAVETIFGYSQQELIGTSIMQLVPTSFELTKNKNIQQCLESGKLKLSDLDSRAMGVKKDGTIFPAMLAISEMFHSTHHNYLIVIHDQTKLEQQKQFYETILEHIPNMVFLKDAKQLRFEYFNRAGEQLVGLQRDQLLGKNDYDFFPKDQADFFVSKDRDVLQSQKVTDIPEEPIQTPKGIRYLHTKKIAISDFNGVARYLLGVSEDITEKKDMQEMLERLAMEDWLTSLANRASFEKALAQEIARSSRHKTKFCCLFIDLDKFKPINDQYGHETGDQVLIAFSDILKKVTRESDVISRWGGDEFVIIITDYENATDVELMKQRINTELANGIQTHSGVMQVDLSFGHAIFPDDAQDAKSLLQQADRTMYIDKQRDQ